MLGIHRTKVAHQGERLALWLAAAIGLAHSMVEFLSLGFLTCDWRPHFVFSEFYDKLCDRP